MPTFNGILTVIATPFTASHEIDYVALEALIEHVLTAGVHAIIPGGTTGEYYAQTVEERRNVLRAVAEIVKGRAQLIAGTNSARPSETVELSDEAKRLGYEALMLAAPFYALPTVDELVTHFRSIATAAGLPIMLYNFPARTGVDMSLEFLERVRDVPQIVAIKESSGSIGRMYQHLVQFGGRYERVCGADDQALDYFLWGATSWVAGASNLLPAEHVALYDACVARQDFLEGRRIMERLLPLFVLMEQGGKYLQYVKFGCALAGIPVGDTRPPLQPLDDAEKAEFRRLYERAKGAGIPAGVR
jgi:4-hydroxy-tetrahydrodipicolinate synthase